MMWNKGKQSKSRKSYSYFKRVKEFAGELQEMGKAAQEFLEFLDSLESRCNKIIEKEERRIEQENEVK